MKQRLLHAANFLITPGLDGRLTLAFSKTIRVFLLCIILVGSASNVVAQSQIYFSNFSNPPAAPATNTFSSFTYSTTALSGWTGYSAATYPAYGSTSSSSGTVTLSFASALALNSNGTDRGKIIVKWGANANRPLNLSVNGATAVQIDAVGVAADRMVVRTITYDIPNATTSLSSMRFTSSGGSGVFLFSVEVQTYAAGTPTVQASNIVFSNAAANSTTIGWTRGNGSSVAVFMKAGAGAITNPVDGSSYSADPAFGSGTQLGSSGYYCVYTGSGTSVNVTGLQSSTAYHVQAFEFSGSGAGTLYFSETAANNPNSFTTAAPPADYRSAASGDWSNAAIWETYNGSTWVTASSAPTLAAAIITVRTGHMINVTADVSLDELTIENDATVNVHSGVTVTIANGAGTDILLNGTLKNTGTFTLASGAAMNVGASGVYEDAQPATTTPIVIPTATWATGSTFVLSGLVGVAGADYNGLQGIKQTFSNFKINTPNLLGKLLLTATGGASAPYMSVSGTLTIDATGTGTGVQLINTNQNGNTLSVGNYVQNGGNVFVLHNASSNATRNFNAGNFTLNNNSFFDIAHTTGSSATNITNTNVAGNVSIASTATLKRTQATAGTVAAFVFNGTSGAQMATFGLTEGPVNITINNAAGVTLGSNVTINGTLTLTNGNLITGNNKVILASTASLIGAGATRWIQGSLQKNIATGATVSTFEIGDANAYKPVLVSFGNVTTAGDLTASISQTDGDHPDVDNSGIDRNKSVNRYWTITNAGVAFDNYSLVLNFDAADVDGPATTTNFVVKKLDGATWSTPTVGTKTATSIEVTGLTSFSEFAVGEAAPMPVTISGIRAEQAGAYNKILWSTSTEVNNAGFEIERSIDGKNFSRIANVASKGDNGNSSAHLHYMFEDKTPVSSTNYYRLKQVDNDGRFNYTNIVTVNRKADKVSLEKVYPTLTSTEVKVLITSSKVENATIVVADITGKVVMNMTVKLQQGDNQYQLRVANLLSGNYIVKLTCANGCDTEAMRFTKN